MLASKATRGDGKTIVFVSDFDSYFSINEKRSPSAAFNELVRRNSAIHGMEEVVVWVGDSAFCTREVLNYMVDNDHCFLLSGHADLMEARKMLAKSITSGAHRLFKHKDNTILMLYRGTDRKDEDFGKTETPEHMLANVSNYMTFAESEKKCTCEKPYSEKAAKLFLDLPDADYALWAAQYGVCRSAILLLLACMRRVWSLTVMADNKYQGVREATGWAFDPGHEHGDGVCMQCQSKASVLRAVAPADYEEELRAELDIYLAKKPGGKSNKWTQVALDAELKKYGLKRKKAKETVEDVARRLAKSKLVVEDGGAQHLAWMNDLLLGDVQIGQPDQYKRYRRTFNSVDIFNRQLYRWRWPTTTSETQHILWGFIKIAVVNAYNICKCYGRTTKIINFVNDLGSQLCSYNPSQQ